MTNRIRAHGGSIARFVEVVLRGIGQVMLQNNPYTGLLFLAGVFYSSRAYGVAVLLGAAVGTLTGIVFRGDQRRLRDGLFGFNGALVGVALALFLHSGLATWVLIIVAAATSTILMVALSPWFEARKLSPLTSPFVLTVFCFLPAYTLFGQLQPTQLLRTAGLPQATHVIGTVSAATLFDGLFRGVAQVFFQPSVITGVLFAVGILICSRRALSAALLGSLIGLLVAWGMGAAEPAIRSGLFGFNCVLTAIALDGVRLASRAVSTLYWMLAIAVAGVVYAALSGALQPAGLSALTLPFVLVVWVFAAAAQSFPGERSATGPDFM